MIEYVCGFMFNHDRSRVILIQKKHGPAELVGKWNGVGGKIEEGESSIQAMSREYKEETGVLLLDSTWNHFATLTNSDWRVYFFEAADHVGYNDARTATDERVGSCEIDELSIVNTVPNLRWLIPMALTHRDSNVQHYQVIQF